MRQYLRNWKMQIIPYTKNSDETYNYRTSMSVRGLKMLINIRDTALGDPLTASFQVYNLNPQIKKALNTGLCYVILEVAYGLDDSKLLPIFQGEIANSYELRQGADLIQSIFARDTGSTITGFKPKLASYANPVPVSALLLELLNSGPNISGIPSYKGSSQAVIASADPIDEWVFGGTFKEEMDNLLKPLNLIWYVSGGVVIIINPDDGSNKGVGDLTPFNVSVNTGLLSRPKVNWVGIEFEHLMNPAFKPGELITIEPQTVQRDFGNELYVPIPGEYVKLSGTFRVMQAIHKGDTRGSEWKTLVKAFHKIDADGV